MRLDPLFCPLRLRLSLPALAGTMAAHDPPGRDRSSDGSLDQAGQGPPATSRMEAT